MAFVFLPNESQESIFAIFVSVAFVLKLADIIHLILLQTCYDIFFMDWERPHEKTLATGSEASNSRPPIKSKSSNERLEMGDEMRAELESQNNVSCWRTLFVANEWNELQTLRKTNTVVRLAFVLLLLNVINLEELTLKDCSEQLFKDRNDYTAPASRVLRLALASSLLLAIWLVQSLAYTLVYSRLVEDKIGQFVDFCSVSNISVFILTHSQYGYYIHGRSPHGNADTSMQRMNEALVREAKDMTCKRGYLTCFCRILLSIYYEFLNEK